MRTAWRLAILGLCLWGSVGRAEDVWVIYANSDPLIYAQDGKPAGPVVAVAERLIAGLPITVDNEGMPVKRLLEITKHHPVIALTIARTPERENDYLWIGELFHEDLVLATKSPDPPIDTLDQARKLHRIGVIHEAVSELFLRNNNLDNFESVSDRSMEAHKFKAGWIDGWLSYRPLIVNSWTAAGFDPAELQFGKPLVRYNEWIAANKEVPADLVNVMRERLAAMRKDGRLAAMLGEFADN